MTTGIILPESTICIQPVFGIEFELDKEGMSEVIEMFENIWNSRTEKEKNIGLCAERAAIWHQLLTIPEKVSFIGKFESFLTHSHMAIDTLVPHAFIVLKNKKDSSKQYIFDIENLIEYKKNDSSELVPAITLYPLTEEKFESFKEKKLITAMYT